MHFIQNDNKSIQFIIIQNDIPKQAENIFLKRLKLTTMIEKFTVHNIIKINDI